MIPVTAAVNKLTNVAPYSNFNPNFATVFPCSSLKPFTAPEMMPIEEKFANETRKTEMMPTVLLDKDDVISAKSIIATNSFVSNFVAMIVPACTTSDAGTPTMNANGAKTYPNAV